jgi:hypothetical protein
MPPLLRPERLGRLLPFGPYASTEADSRSLFEYSQPSSRTKRPRPLVVKRIL